MTISGSSILDAWLTGVNAGNLDEVVALYDDEAILLPTFSKNILSDHYSILGYFEELARKGEVSVSLVENTLTCQKFDAKVEVISGFYDWYFADEERIVKARFTYITDVAKSSPILHHHSSLVP